MSPRRSADANESNKLQYALLGFSTLLLLATGVFAIRFFTNTTTTIHIATGSPGGTYAPLGAGIAQVLNQDRDLNRELGVVAEVVAPTHGSPDNMARLEAGKVELALVQNDTPAQPGNPSRIRTLAVLYDEVLHVLVRAYPNQPAPTSLPELAGYLKRPLAIGAAKSGTADLVAQLLAHFEIADPQRGPYVNTVTQSTADAIQAFRDGEVDGVCVLSGLPSAAASTLIDAGAILVPVGSVGEGSTVDGVRVEHPYVSRAIIPERVYATRPTRPIGTLAVKAVLVAREDLPDDVVRAITRTIFYSKVELAKSHIVGAQLAETFDATGLRFPLHLGAEAYYRRDDPPFMVRYAEALSLCVTLLLGCVSAMLGLKEWFKRAKKNRIDVFYLEVDELADLISPERSLTELEELKAKLLRVRRAAFDELVDEKLLADESFTIFQDFLRTEMGEVDKRLSSRRKELGLTDSGKVLSLEDTKRLREQWEAAQQSKSG